MAGLRIWLSMPPASCTSATAYRDATDLSAWHPASRSTSHPLAATGCQRAWSLIRRQRASRRPGSAAVAARRRTPPRRHRWCRRQWRSAWAAAAGVFALGLVAYAAGARRIAASRRLQSDQVIGEGESSSGRRRAVSAAGHDVGGRRHDVVPRSSHMHLEVCEGLVTPQDAHRSWASVLVLKGGKA